MGGEMRIKQVLLLSILLSVAGNLQAEKARNPKPSDTVVNPVPLVQTTPAYPEEAHRAKVQGVVWLQAIIRKNGRVDKFKLIKRPPGRAGWLLSKAAAEEIARNWRFKPGTLNGKPVDVLSTMEVQFKLK